MPSFPPIRNIDWTNDYIGQTYEALHSSAIIPELLDGDLISAVNGTPRRPKPWSPSPFYPLNKDKGVVLTVERGDETFDTYVSFKQPSRALLLERSYTSFAAMITLLAALPMVLFAEHDKRDAWLAAGTFIGMSLGLAAANAARFSIPFASPTSLVVIPIASIGMIHLGQLPRFDHSDASPKVLGRLKQLLWLGVMLYIPFQLTYTFLLCPNGLFGLSYFEDAGFIIQLVARLYLIGGLLSTPVLLGIRYVRAKSTYERNQIFILFVSVTVAVVPYTTALLLSYLGVDTGDRLILCIPLALGPLGFGYVIYRRDHFKLDFFVTRTLTILLLLLAFSGLYFLIRLLLVGLFNLSNASFLLAFIPIVAAALLFTPLSGRTVSRVVQGLIYGAAVPYQASLDEATRKLSDNPRQQVVREVVDDMLDLLQVRRGALYKTTRNDMLGCIEHIRTNRSAAIPLQLCKQLKEPVLRKQLLGSVPDLDHYLPEWADLIVPLISRNNVTGLLVLDRPKPDGYFQAQQIQFVEKMANLLAIASESISLFEGALTMSQQLTGVADRERAQIASRIHDQPLQTVSLATHSVERISDKIDGSHPAEADALRALYAEITTASRQLREICQGLYPPVIRQGLEWILKEVVYAQQDRLELEVALDLALPPTLYLNESESLAIYHIVTEALNNVHKHAQASKVIVQCAVINDVLHLKLADNGVGSPVTGFDLARLVRNQHFGLAGMYNWAQSVHGQLAYHNSMLVDGQPFEGTVVHLSLPVG